AEGLVDHWTNADKTAATLVEVNCETDFVARNDQFQGFVEEVTEAIGEAGIASIDELEDVEVGGTPVPEEVNEQISTLGENVNIRRIERIDNPDGTIGAYIHAGSQIGVLVSVDVDGDAQDDDVQRFARDVAMHIAAMNPPYLSPEQIPDEDLEAQKEVYASQMEEQGKPDHIIPQIVEGKMGKWKSENSLLDQPFVKDSDRTVGELQEDRGNVELVSFTRFEVGEGIETDDDEENFAEEVADQLDD
ncbi:MAG: translation elongation factor Ts, partial [Bradymonadaceae bacterium]